jgi:hypothetical protein
MTLAIGVLSRGGGWMFPNVKPGGRVPGAPKANTGDPLRLSRVTTQPRSAVVTRRAEPAVARDFAQFGECQPSDGVSGSPSRAGRLCTVVISRVRSCARQAPTLIRRENSRDDAMGLLLYTAFCLY